MVIRQLQLREKLGRLFEIHSRRERDILYSARGPDGGIATALNDVVKKFEKFKKWRGTRTRANKARSAGQSRKIKYFPFSSRGNACVYQFLPNTNITLAGKVKSFSFFRSAAAAAAGGGSNTRAPRLTQAESRQCFTYKETRRHTSRERSENSIAFLARHFRVVELSAGSFAPANATRTYAVSAIRTKGKLR